MDPLTVLAASAVGFVTKELLGELTKGTLEDYVKDFIKDRIGNVALLAKKNALAVAIAKALKEFWEQVESQLSDDCDRDNEEIATYKKEFFLRSCVGEVFPKGLRSLFSKCIGIDTRSSHPL